jgi:hypothetical protein
VPLLFGGGMRQNLPESHAHHAVRGFSLFTSYHFRDQNLTVVEVSLARLREACTLLLYFLEAAQTCTLLDSFLIYARGIT